jgi:Cdc6-like AAA superfamily ATPase
MQVGRHVGLYGEHGVGKTSFARVLALILDSSEVRGFRSTMINCNSESTFESLWEALFRGLSVESVELSPEGIRSALEADGGRTLIVIDELDRLDDDETLTLLADTIKTLSDHAVATTLLLVGLATSKKLDNVYRGRRPKCLANEGEPLKLRDLFRQTATKRG